MAEIFEKISWEDIAKYSHWPKRLTGEEPFSVRPKTPESVTREFNDEKWAALYDQAKDNPSMSLLEIEDLEVNFKNKTALLWHGDFYLTTERGQRDRNLELCLETLRPYAKEATAIVEFGAGFGGKILNVAQDKDFRHLPSFAGEFTSKGQDLIRLLAKRMGLKTAVGYCDFAKLESNGFEKIPPGAILFTSYAAHYVPHLPEDFPAFFAKFKPRIVVHFEPVLELHNTGSRHDQMVQKYFELNDYTRNLRSVLKASEMAGKIKILREQKNVIGGNPFLPISITEWSPR